MSNRKGISFDEKQKRLLGAMQRKGEFYIFKELEAMAKNQGIVVQSTKDVVQALVDDNLVTVERIGSQNVYWVTKKAAQKSQTEELASLRESENRLVKQLEELSEKTASLSASQFAATEIGGDPKNVSKINELKDELRELKTTVENYEETSEGRIEHMRVEIGFAKSAAVRWYDNICVAREWVKKNTGKNETEINDAYNLSPSLEEDISTRGVQRL